MPSGIGCPESVCQAVILTARGRDGVSSTLAIVLLDPVRVTYSLRTWPSTGEVAKR
jgi:hypothetical protein